MSALLRLAISGVALAATAYLGGVGVLWAAQDRLVFPGSAISNPLAFGRARHAAKTAKPLSLADHGLFQAQQILTEDGLTLTFWSAPPQEEMPVILYFHGNAGTAVDWLIYVERYVREGYGVVVVEYRGYGGNPGHPSETGLIADAGAQAHWAAQRWPDSKLVFWGESLGTAVAVALAAEAERTGIQPAGIILDSAFTSVREAASLHFPCVPVGPLLRNPFDSLARIPQVTAPILALHGDADRVVPIVLGQKLFAAARCRTEGIFLHGVAHLVAINDKSGAADAAIDRFLTNVRDGIAMPPLVTEAASVSTETAPLVTPLAFTPPSPQAAAVPVPAADTPFG